MLDPLNDLKARNRQMQELPHNNAIGIDAFNVRPRKKLGTYPTIPKQPFNSDGFFPVLFEGTQCYKIPFFYNDPIKININNWYACK